MYRTLHDGLPVHNPDGERPSSFNSVPSSNTQSTCLSSGSPAFQRFFSTDTPPGLPLFETPFFSSHSHQPPLNLAPDPYACRQIPSYNQPSSELSPPLTPKSEAADSTCSPAIWQGCQPTHSSIPVDFLHSPTLPSTGGEQAYRPQSDLEPSGIDIWQSSPAEENFQWQAISAYSNPPTFGAHVDANHYSILNTGLPPTMTDLASPQLSSPLASPDKKRELLRPNCMDDADGSVNHPGQALPGGEANAKVDLPYSQLIGKALMAIESHALTLPKIYQWFRENTDKAKNENRRGTTKGKSEGWKNSVRHNLSMNQAFDNREQAQTDADAASNPSKKPPKEWFITEDAIKNGIKSTTRYRKSNGKRANRDSENPPPHPQPLANKAASGRLGGKATSKSKANRMKVNHRVRTVAQALPANVHGESHGVQADNAGLLCNQQNYYGFAPSCDYAVNGFPPGAADQPSPSVRSTIDSPIQTSAVGTPMMATTNSPGYSQFTSEDLQGPPGPIHEHPPQPFGLADVTGVYQSGQGQVHATTETLLPAYADALFVGADVDDSRGRDAKFFCRLDFNRWPDDDGSYES